MGHPNGKVARASHSMFAAFMSSGKDLDQDERVSLKEQLVFYYMQRSLLVLKAIKIILIKHELDHQRLDAHTLLVVM